MPGARLLPQPGQQPGAVTTASQRAVRRWFEADPPMELRPLAAEALSQLAAAVTDAARRIQPG